MYEHLLIQPDSVPSQSAAGGDQKAESNAAALHVGRCCLCLSFEATAVADGCSPRIRIVVAHLLVSIAKHFCSLTAAAFLAHAVYCKRLSGGGGGGGGWWQRRCMSARKAKPWAPAAAGSMSQVQGSQLK
jgi:hypothetical protein